MNPYLVPGLILVVVVTVGIGAYGLRFARTTSDFLVASRAVSPSWNAAAISGEYLSAASFLGVAGLILRYGVDVLWYPVGFAAGYLALLLFVAAPAVGSVKLFGVNLPWLLLGVLSFPFLVGVGWAYVRWAERNEQDFIALIRKPEQ